MTEASTAVGSNAIQRLPRRFTMRKMFVWLTVVGVSLALISYPIHQARLAYHHMSTSLRPYQLSYAMHAYVGEHGHFPSAAVENDGRPMHSWRVLLAPYFDEPEWYAGYDLDRPWNSPANEAHCRSQEFCRELFAATDAHNVDAYSTNFVVVRGPGTLFPDNTAVGFKDILDGASNTLMLVQIPPSNIAWYEPRDLDIRTMSFQINDRTQPCIGNSRGDGAWVAFVDGRTQWLPNSTPPETIRQLLTIAGGEGVVDTCDPSD